MKKAQKESDELPTCEWHTDINLSLVPYWFLVLLRVVITILPQNGYIHPDEYFQSIEIVAGVSSTSLLERLIEELRRAEFICLP
jgi:hypothetical protein